MATSELSNTREEVKEYYGKTLQRTEDLKTNACLTCAKPPEYLREVLKLVHDDVASRYYGCGMVLPVAIGGATIIDLGSGSGRDCFALSKLVGPNGHVIGVDMTDEQVNLAQSYVEYHTKKFGYSKPNVEFRKGYIEDLTSASIKDASVDIIVSNCVVNLSPQKDAVLREAYRVLKDGGEMYFSDVYSDRRIPEALKKDRTLWGECLSGALYWNDFLRIAHRVGFADVRLVEDAPITVNNPALESQLGPIRFFSATYRLFKIPQLESDCEDYGQAVRYKGTISAAPVVFNLDAHHRIEKGKMFPVCRNTFLMLQRSRFAPHFDFFGDESTHYGIYADCGKGLPFASANTSSSSSCGTSSQKGGGCCL